MTSLDKTALEKAVEAVRKALTETWQDSINARSWDQDILLTGCRAAKYEKPTEAAENLAAEAAAASVSAYLSHAAGEVAGEPVAWIAKHRWEHMTNAEPWLTNAVYSENQEEFSCVPLYGADAVAALSAENARLREELGDAQSMREFYRNRAGHWRLRYVAEKIEARVAKTDIRDTYKPRAEAAEARVKDLEEDKALYAEIGSKAIKFQIGEIYVESRGLNAWVVSNLFSVRNTHGEWEWEPMPSNRSKDFISRTRFQFHEAWDIARTLSKESSK